MGIGFIALVFAAQQPDLPRLPPPSAVEVAPAPHLPGPPFGMVAVQGGYRVTLNRATAEMLQDALERANEKELAATLRKKAQEKKEANPDDATVATLDMIAFAVQTQLPGFKKELAQKMGPNGVVITLTGLQAPTVKFRKPRPKLERAAELVREAMPLLPDEARAAIEAVRAAGRTTPLFWKVEPRE